VHFSRSAGLNLKGLVAVNRTKVLEAAQKFLSKGQYDKAVLEYQKLVQEDPRDVRTLLKIGDLHTRRSKPKDAIDVYQRVADLYAKQGFFLKAVAVYKQILKLDPSHLESTQKLAKMYEELALTSDALSTYELVADAYTAQGNMPKALETMERMVELDAQNVAVRIKQAEALSKAGKASEAASAFAAGAALLKEQGRMDDYLRVVERQLYHDPENVQIARELSGLYLERSDPKRALAKLQICFKADPRDVQTLEMLAEAFRQLGQSAKTISVLKEIARLHNEAGADEARRLTLKRVLELDANDAEAKQALSAVAAAAPKVVESRPTAAPPRRPAPQPPPVAVKGAPVKPPAPVAAPAANGANDDLELEAEEELELLEGSEPDEVLIVDEVSSASSSGRVSSIPALEDPVHALLAEGDAREGAGDYEGAVSALQGVLELEPDHVAAHERLKDIYLAADRRVDAVKELLWLSSACEADNHDRAVHYAEAARELAPQSEATRRRLTALGVALPGENNVRRTARNAAIDAELDAMLPPVATAAPAVPARRDAPAGARSAVTEGPVVTVEADLLELEFSPDDFDAAPPVLRGPQVSRELAAELLEQDVSAEDFDRVGSVRPAAAAPARQSQPAEVVHQGQPSREFAAIGTSELSISDAPEPLPAPAQDSAPAGHAQAGNAQVSSAFEGTPPTATHEYTLDDQHYSAAPEPTLTGEPLPDLLRRTGEQDESVAAKPSVAAALPEPSEPPQHSGAHQVYSQTPAQPLAAEIEEVLDEAEFFASQGMLDEALEVVQEAILIYPRSDELKRRLEEYEAKAEQDAADAERESASGADDSFDIAEQLANELVEVDQPAEADEMVDVESVFAQFKKGVAEQIAPDDSETHFDLGIAYKEMGLTNDAISEFELAAKSKKRACTALNMIGMCHLERGKTDLALQYFQRALDAEGRGPAEELALNYEIGTVYEQTGQLDRALAAFELVAARDRTYRGVSVKLDQLKKRGIKSASR
jgi:pilus assembly protein FimV